jgi:hypothetical protein
VQFVQDHQVVKTTAKLHAKSTKKIIIVIIVVFLIPRLDRRRYPNLESHLPIDSSITQLPLGLSSSLVIASLAP